MKAQKTEQNISKVESRIRRLTLSDIIASVSDDDLKAHSYLFTQLMDVEAPDPAWLKFSGLIGRFEIALGDMMRSNQRNINYSLQLLQILMNAESKIQLVEIYKKLKEQRKRLPSLVRSIAAGAFGGQLAAQQTPIAIPVQPGTDWTTYETVQNGPQPVAYGAVTIASSKARFAGVTENAIGIAVSVSGPSCEVATDGQKIKNVPAERMKDLSAGEMLFVYPNGYKDRYLITLPEATTLLAPFSFIKCIGRVLRNDVEQRTIVVEDRDLAMIPPP